MSLGPARALADTVLYEGYVLYPYRAGADKNRVRWQWGVLMPPDVVERDGSERSMSTSEVIIDGPVRSVRILARFLQVIERTVHDRSGAAVDRLETPDAIYTPFDEARPIELEFTVSMTADDKQEFNRHVPGEDWLQNVPGGTLARRCQPLTVGVKTKVRRPETPEAPTLLAVTVANLTGPSAGDERSAWLRRALVACHLLLETGGGHFLSLTDPPEWATGLASECFNDGLFPVLASSDDRIALSSPIILYDHAEVAPESASNFFDGLEIDELLSLRTMTLSEEEKREARGTDPRVAALLGEVDDMPPELWDRLHGTVRYLEAIESAEDSHPDAPWWDPGADASVDPEHDSVSIGGSEVRRGSRVLLRPGTRRADAYDMFLAGRTATVSAVLHDVDGGIHLAVTIDDDPGAELMTAHGRYLYFAPDEVEPLHHQAEAS